MTLESTLQSKCEIQEVCPYFNLNSTWTTNLNFQLESSTWIFNPNFQLEFYFLNFHFIFSVTEGNTNHQKWKIGFFNLNSSWKNYLASSDKFPIFNLKVDVNKSDMCSDSQKFSVRRKFQIVNLVFSFFQNFHFFQSFRFQENDLKFDENVLKNIFNLKKNWQILLRKK